MTGDARSDGILYGPTANGKLYLSMFTHRGARPVKTAWHRNVSPEDEYDLFCRSDDGDWKDERGHYWSLGKEDGSTELGMTGERLAKHPSNANAGVPWHGYPVSPRRRGDADSPTDQLISRWVEDGVITRSFARRIRDRRI
ncbi:hypothetical protein ACWCO3_22280 [Micromonospora sp. NPDC002411]